MELKSRFTIYHSHYSEVIGKADTIEKAIFIGEQHGCKDYDCPCCKYKVYDNKLKTYDMTKIIKARIKDEDYQFYRKTGKWRK